MNSVDVKLDKALVDFIRKPDRPIDETAQELFVVELYRRGTLASGRAAELLGMGLVEFIQYSSRLGIPFFDTTDEEWEVERRTIDALWSA